MSQRALRGQMMKSEDTPVENVAPQLEHVGEVPLQGGGGQEDALMVTARR